MTILPLQYSLVIHENVGAFDVAMKEVLAVTIGEAFEQLVHDAGDVFFGEIHHPRLQQPHQIVIHVFEDEIKRAAVLNT